MHFSTASEVLAHMHSLGLFHTDLTLSRMRDAVHNLGLTRPPFTVVQIVGTNGKGSTAAFLSALTQAHGLRTGLFTSPHLVCPSERIRINGRTVPLEYWPALANRCLRAQSDLTYFELCTALALLAFAEFGVDVAVLEAGLGGRYDATTAVNADIVCVTPVGLDHEAVLGPSLASIAADKAGAIRSAAPIIMAAQAPEVLAIFTEAAHLHTAPLSIASPALLPPSWPLGLLGGHQRGNACLALAAWHCLAAMRQVSTSTEVQRRALAQAFVPGRMQYVPDCAQHPPVLLDGAHNAHGMTALAHALAELAIAPSAIIFTCMADKNWDSLLPIVTALRCAAGAVPFFVPQLHTPRAAQPHILAARLNALAHATLPTQAAVQPVPTLAEALAWAAHKRVGGGPVLICGSLYLLGEFFTLFPCGLSSGHS